MTKEELEKEAQRSFDELDDWCVGDDWSIEESYKNGYSNGAEPREKRIAELEEKISVLLSCKNCPENKGGFICVKEYENKCLAQKIQYIKELKEENENLKKTYRKQRNKRIDELQKENAELKETVKNVQEFYEKEYFQIADREVDEKIKELEQYQEEVTVDDYSPYDENTWGMMHEEMFVPKELARDLLKESYALSEHRKDQLTKAKEIIKKLKALYLSPVVTKDDVKRQDKILEEVEQFLNCSEKPNN